MAITKLKRIKKKTSKKKHVILTISLAILVIVLLFSQLRQLVVSNFYKVFAGNQSYSTILTNIEPVADTGAVGVPSWAYVAHPTTKDWIGLYASGSADSAPLARYYVSYSTTLAINCTTTPGKTAQSSGACMFPIPLTIPAGTYEFRLFSNDSYTRLGSPAPITITTPNLTTSPTNVVAGGTTSFSWQLQARSSNTDWIGFFAKGAPNSQRIDWDYVSCTKTPTTEFRSGTCSFTIPSYVTSGTYEFRFFDDSYGQTGTSNPITVSGTNAGPMPTLTQAPDTTGPIVTITYPPYLPAGSLNTGVIQPLAATATDPSGVAKVEFYVNDSLICTDTTSPYTCDWKIPGKHGTYYTFKDKAYDTLGNSSTSASITDYAW